MPTKTTKPIKKPTTAKKPAVPVKKVKAESSFTLPVMDKTGKQTETVDLPKEVFDVVVSPRLIAQAVYVLQTNKRQGNAHTKTRGDVNGSGRKIYRQKGTGRARHGDRYAPIFVGGGVAHGPKTKNWQIKLTDSMRRKAFAGVLTAKRKENNITIIDGLEKMTGKSKQLVEVLSKLAVSMKQSKPTEKVLVLTPVNRMNVYKGLRNVENVEVRDASLANVYDIINTKKLILEKSTLPILAKRV